MKTSQTDGTLVQVTAPAGGPAWIITDPELARTVLNDIRFAKDPALAPPGWDSRTAGLEPTAAVQLSVTTLDGPAHQQLRRAYAPLFSASRMQAAYGGMLAIARQLLADLDSVDLVEDFTSRYPLTILCDLLGVPAGHVDAAIHACRLIHEDYPVNVGPAMASFSELAAAALETGRGLAAELAERMPKGTSQQDLNYQIFTLLFAGQLTTDLTIGFLVARLLGDPAAPTDNDLLVRETLRQHPPAPVTLWRFTSTEVEIAGVRLPAQTPVLIDIHGTELTFGAGPHYCIGAQLAQLELRALVEVLRTDYPHARLGVPFHDLEERSLGGIMGSRLLSLPVSLR